jgi:hypothetical protein
MPNLDTIRRQVQEDLLDDLKKGLTTYRNLLSSDSEQYNTIILLTSQYNSANKRLNNGLMSAAQADPTFNRIRNSLLEMLEDLKPGDLKEAPTPNGNSGGSASSGYQTGGEEAREPGPLRLFISYAHEDEPYKDRLKEELMVLERTEAIKIWDDRSLLVGSEWDKEIVKQLETADIICLLVTKDFVASDYCWSKELKMAIDRHNAGTIKIAPIIIKKVPHFSRLPFAHIVALPTDAKPVETWENGNQAWENVGVGIARLVDSLHPHG